MTRALFIVLLLAHVALAQLQFTATASRTSAQVGETIEVTFTFTGAAVGVPTPQPSDYVNLDLVGGPSTSTQTSIVNGRSSSSKSFTYYFRTKAPGKATIGPVQVNYKNRNYTTSPIQIAVTNAASGTNSGRRDEVFIQVASDKREAFVGEQIVLTYKLYFSTSVYAPEFKELPQSTGFWTEEFDMPSQLVPRDEVVDGQSYKSVVIRKVALFATTAGELTVDPLVAQVQVERRNNSRRRANDPFNDPFFNLGVRRESLEVTCRSLKLKINPLPDTARPQGDVAVGKYSLATRLDKTKCETNDAVTLTVLVRGTGNIKTIPTPIITLPPDFEAFDPKTSESIRRGPETISGAKTFEIVLIPRAPGTQVIPEISLPVFDPVAQRFDVLKSGPLTMNVTRGSGRASDGSLPVASKREVQTVGQDITYVKPALGELVPLGRQPHQSAAFWLSIATPWVLLAGVMFAVRRQVRVGQTLTARRRRVIKKARAALQIAEKANAENKTEQVSAALIDVAQMVANEWTDVRTPTATWRDKEAEWRLRGFAEDHWQALTAANQLAELSRFAGGQSSLGELKNVIDNLLNVLRELEGGAV